MKKGWLTDAMDPFAGLGTAGGDMRRSPDPMQYGGVDPMDPLYALLQDRTGLYGYRSAKDFINTHEAPDPLYNDQPYGFSQQYQEGPYAEQNIRDAGYGYLFDQAVPQQSGLGGLLSKLFSRHR